MKKSLVIAALLLLAALSAQAQSFNSRGGAFNGRTGGGVGNIMSVELHANAGGASTMTDLSTGPTFISGSARHITKVNLAGYKQVRLVGAIGTVGSTGSTARLLYKTSYSATASDYSDIGTSAVSIDLTGSGVQTSSWIDLATAAKTDVFIAVAGYGGDGVADPALGTVSAQFR